MVGVRGRRRRAVERVWRVIAVGNNWPNHPAFLKIRIRECTVFDLGHNLNWRVETVDDAAGNNEAFHLIVAVNGFGFEIPTKLGFGVKVENGRVIITAVIHQNRLIVCQKFRKQRQHEQHRKNNQRVKGAPVVTEIAPAAFVQRAHVLRLSKSMRGSTSTYIKSEMIPIKRPTRPKTNNVPKITG